MGAFQTQIGLSGAVALDGKTLRRPGQDVYKLQHLLVAVTHGTSITLAQVAVGERTNEIPEALRMLERPATVPHAHRELIFYPAQLLDFVGA